MFAYGQAHGRGGGFDVHKALPHMVKWIAVWAPTIEDNEKVLALPGDLESVSLRLIQNQTYPVLIKRWERKVRSNSYENKEDYPNLHPSWGAVKSDNFSGFPDYTGNFSKYISVQETWTTT